MQTHPARANFIFSPLSPTGRRASKEYFRLIRAKWYFAGGFALDGPHYADNLGLASTCVQPGRSGSVFNGEERSESQSRRVDKGL